MNNFKVSIEDYKLALENRGIELNIKLQDKINYFENKFKKSRFFKKPTELEISEYSLKLNNIDWNWSIMQDEYCVLLIHWKIQNNIDIFKALDLVKDEYFSADDETLEFIHSYINILI